MKRVYVLGAGRVGQVLASALYARGALAGWWTRARAFSGPAASLGSHRWPDGSALSAVDLVLVCVSDDAIDRVVRALASTVLPAGLVVLHTSGVRGPEALAGLPDHVSSGCWHPLHAVQPHEPVSAWRGAFCALDGDGPALRAAEELTGWIGGVAGSVPAAAREAYHLAAVLAGNTVHAALYAAGQVADHAAIRSDALDAGLARLAAQSATAAGAHGVDVAATGPIVRGDLSTVRRHLGHASLGAHERALYRAAAALLLQLAETRTHQLQARQMLSDWLTAQPDGGEGPTSSS